MATGDVEARLQSASGNSRRILFSDRSERPEVADESDAVKDRAGFIDRRPPEGGIEARSVPLLRQLPRLLNRHRRTASDVSPFAPAVDVLFRPEEQDVRSGIEDVIPEVFRRHLEVNDAVAKGVTAADA